MGPKNWVSGGIQILTMTQKLDSSCFTQNVSPNILPELDTVALINCIEYIDSSNLKFFYVQIIALVSCVATICLSSYYLRKEQAKY